MAPARPDERAAGRRRLSRTDPGTTYGGARRGTAPPYFFVPTTTEERTVASRIPDPADPFEEQGLASPESGLAGKRITGDPQDDVVVPGDEPTAVDDFGTTAGEERAGEPMNLRLAREQPDLSARGDADESPGADQPYPEDPDERVGRLVDPDEGAREDEEPDAVGSDVGTDAGGFSAEERAMHIEPGA